MTLTSTLFWMLKIVGAWNLCENTYMNHRTAVCMQSRDCYQVRSTAAHREREDDALLQRMHAATVRLDMVLEGSTSPAVALKKAQASYIKRWKEQSADFSEVLAAWNVARATAANVTTDFTSVSFTSNSSNVMSGRSPGRHGATATNSPKSGSKIDGVLQRLSQDESNISAVAAIATPAHARSTALRADASPKHVDHVNPNTRCSTVHCRFN